MNLRMHMYICCAFFSTNQMLSWKCCLQIRMHLYLYWIYLGVYSPYITILLILVVPRRDLHFKGRHIYIFINEHMSFDSSAWLKNTSVTLSSKFDQDEALSTAVTNESASDAVRPFNNSGIFLVMQKWVSQILRASTFCNNMSQKISILTVRVVLSLA